MPADVIVQGYRKGKENARGLGSHPAKSRPRAHEILPHGRRESAVSSSTDDFFSRLGIRAPYDPNSSPEIQRGAAPVLAQIGVRPPGQPATTR